MYAHRRPSPMSTTAYNNCLPLDMHQGSPRGSGHIAAQRSFPVMTFYSRLDLRRCGGV